MNDLLFATEINILVLLLIACFAAVALKRIQFPYTIGLVVIGLLLGWLSSHVEEFEILKTLSLSHDLILFVLVPPLIFESALNLDARLLLKNLSSILLLAAPGLVISTLIVGGILGWCTPLTLSQAFLFGALISASDPVAVIGLFKELGAPQKLAVLVEGESLFNDATAIVVFNIILGGLAVSESTADSNLTMALTQGVFQFLASLIGGILVGGAIGYCSRPLMTMAKDSILVLFTITMVLAYGAFLLAEETVEVSGVIAVVSAGLTVGWFKSNRLSPESGSSVEEFWEYSAFLANSLIFLLVGLTISSSSLFAEVSQTISLASALGISIIAIVLARAVVVFGLLSLLNLVLSQIGKEPIDRRYQVVSFWGGLRGAVCLALALSLSIEFPNRDLVVALTLGIVLFTLLVQGTTMGQLIRLLRLDRPELADRWSQAIANVALKKNMLKSAEIIEEFQPHFSEVSDRFQQQYQTDLVEAEQSLEQLKSSTGTTQEELQKFAWLTAFAMERKSYYRLYGQGLMSKSVLDQFLVRVTSFQDSILSREMSIIRTQSIPVENRRFGRIQAIVEKIFPESRWLTQRQESDNISRYEYCSILIRVSAIVSSQLGEFAQKAGDDFVLAAQPCLTFYEQEQSRAQCETEKLAEEFPDLVMARQMEISDRIAQKLQQDAIEALVEEGTISNSAAAQLSYSLQ